MDKFFKQEWIRALRSGKFEQGQQMLHNTESNTYCCIGVLCEIVPAMARIDTEYRTTYSENSTEIDVDMLEYFGLSEETQVGLIEMNDKEGLSFAKIADYIEENL